LAPTGTPHKLIISQVVPGVGIEVFNAGTTAVDVHDIWFCSSFDYQNANATSGKTSIAPGAFVVMDWPDTPNYAVATSTAGELLLYSDSEFPSPENLQSYVCWGAYVDGTGRKTDAFDTEIYTDDCAPALTNGAISRKPGTNGRGQDSYDTAAVPALADCPL
jgi:hypothetical protein